MRKNDRFLLLLLLGVYLPLGIFAVLAVGIWQHGKGFLWDIPILQAVHATANPDWQPYVYLFSKLGVFWGVFPAATVVAFLLIYLRRWRSLSYLAFTLLGNIVINRTAKIVFHRERPSLWEVFSHELDYAFPSGHAMSSMSFVAVLIILTWGSRWWWWVLISGGAFVTAIGWTRLYLAVHFPSDILAGWMLSLAWAIGGSLLIHPLEEPELSLEKPPDTPTLTEVD